MSARCVAILLIVLSAAFLPAASAAAAPPPVPFGVSASQTGATNEVRLGWGTSADAVGYHIHRSSDPLFVPGDANLVRITDEFGWDHVPAPGAYTYRVVAMNQAGERSAPSAGASVGVQFDASAVPPLSIVSPSDGATVSGTVPIVTDVGDLSRISNLALRVDIPTRWAHHDTTGTLQWDSTTIANGEHVLLVTVSGRNGMARTVARRVVVDNPRAASLIAAYGLDAGSGTTAADSSGYARNGTIEGATWVPGRHGNALQFDGRDDSVVLPPLGPAATLEAWVRKSGTKRDVAAVGSWDGSDGGGPMLWVDHSSGRWTRTLGFGAATYLDSGRAPVTGAWQHLATTFDHHGVARFYIDGTQVAERIYPGLHGAGNHWRIGAYGATAGRFFDGAVDEVRVYLRALTAAEVRADMQEPVAASPPPLPPTAPELTATGGISTVRLSWTSAARASGYSVHRSKTPGFVPGDGNRIARPEISQYGDTGLAGGTYYYVVVAENDGGATASNEVRVNVTADTTAPQIRISWPSNRRPLSGTVFFAASAEDDVGQLTIRLLVDGELIASGHTYWDTTTVANGTHTLTASATDAVGNVGTAVLEVTVDNTRTPPPAGPLAVYSFEQGSAEDSSGHGRDGTIAGATPTAAGRHGGALEFDGVDDRVDLPALGTFYTSGFTLEAWVRKAGAARDAAIVGTWTTSGDGGVMLWADHLLGNYRVTLGEGLENYLDSGRNPAAGEWHHVAAMQDGNSARIYVDGELAATSHHGILAFSNRWRIGAYGDVPRGFFKGTIDEVRIYDRALSVEQLKADMAAGPPVADPPPPPTGFAADRATERTVATSWTAPVLDDGVEIARYLLYANGEKVGETTATTFEFTGLECDRDHELAVGLRDSRGLASDRVTLTARTAACPQSDGLVAAYGFDEASGTVAADASGHGHAGTLAGATWVSGRWGTTAAGFTGAGRVDLPALGTFYDRAFTLEAWVNPAAVPLGDRAVLGTWDNGAGGGPMLWIDHKLSNYHLTLNRGAWNYLNSARGPVRGAWQHLAATYDRATARIYIDGAEVGSRAFTGDVGNSDSWRIGAYGATPTGFFSGAIDDVRIYDRALGSGEIRNDMETPVRP